ncbi:hypothetical protein CDAR_12651 [Caerostris darwini]|uniref:Uncharacterized protein n=1 Tax=Caerostris darwini TaxID=1538125 RepID=A0AAV4QZI7_9ARAC|nr:hypothetical protein CDAR_12651 [Caerostris darwini]
MAKEFKQLVSIIWMHAVSSESSRSQQESLPAYKFTVPILGFDKKLSWHTCSVNTTSKELKQHIRLHPVFPVSPMRCFVLGLHAQMKSTAN